MASLFSPCFVLECYFAVSMGWVLLGLGFLRFGVSLSFCIHGNKSEGRKGSYWKVGNLFLSPASPLSVLSLGTNRHHVCHYHCFFDPKTRLVLNLIGR